MPGYVLNMPQFSTDTVFDILLGYYGTVKFCFELELGG